MEVVQIAGCRRGVVDRGWLVGAILHDEPIELEKGGNCRHDAHPGDPSSTSRGFAGLCARSGNDRPLLDRRGRATRRGSPPAHLAAPPDGVEKQTLLVTRANHETGRGTFDLSGPLASGPDRAQAKTRLPAPGSRQKAQKAPRRPWLQNRYQQLADHREQRSPIYHLPPYLPRSARGQGCPCNRQFCDGRHSAGRGPGNMLRAILTDRGLRDGQRS